MNKTISGLMTLLLLALISFAVVGQDDSNEPVDPAAEDEPEVLEQEFEEPRLIPAEPTSLDPADTQTAPEDDATAVPSPQEPGEDVEGAAGPGATGEVKANMERFVPSEKISEDRSVAFPNDI